GPATLSLAFTPDGRALVSGGLDRTVCVRDPLTAQALRPPLSTRYGVFSVAVSRDGRWLAAGQGQRLEAPSPDAELRLWDLTAGTDRVLPGHQAPVVSVAFSPDGKLLASGSLDGTIKLWEPAGAKLLRTLAGT